MTIRVDGLNIDYRDEGSGLPVILIHAFPLNQSMWNDQRDELRTLCRAITLDLRGFGASDAPAGPYSMDRMAADVRALMSALDITQAVLVGLSMGGYISLAFYRNYPEAVRAMVLADTRATSDTPEARERRLKSAEKVEREGPQAIADDMIPLLLGNTSLTSRPQIVERVRSMIEANTPAGIAGAQRGMADRNDSTDLLGRIDFPLLVVVGSEDTLTPVKEAESLLGKVKTAEMRIIESAGHLSNLEQPQQFNAILRTFIESLERA